DRAKWESGQALSKAESTQKQLDAIVIEGDSSVEAAQARVDEIGESHATLKARIDGGFIDVRKRLVDTENIIVKKNPQYKYEDVKIAPNKASRVINPTSDEKYVFDLLFHVSSSENMQGMTFHNGHYYIGFDVGGGNGRIRKYTAAGSVVTETCPIGIGHAAGLACRKSNGRVYVVNGGGSTPTRDREADVETSRITKAVDLSFLANAGVIGIDNLNDRLVVHTAPDNIQPPTFSIVDFEGDIISQFNIPNQGIPQGLDCYSDQIYYYSNDKITIMDFEGVILGTINVPKAGESVGLTIAGDYSTINISVGYNSPNRVYALRTIENKVYYNTLQPLTSFNKRWEVSSEDGRKASHIPLIPKFAAIAINNTAEATKWALADWTNVIDHHPFVKSVTQTTSDIKVELKQGFGAVAYFSAVANDFLIMDGRHAAVNYSGNTLTITIRDKDGATVNPSNARRYSTISLLVIGGVAVES